VDARVNLELIDGADDVFAGVDTAPLIERSITFWPTTTDRAYPVL